MFVIFVHACFMCICLKTIIWLFWDKVWIFLMKTGWQPCLELPAGTAVSAAPGRRVQWPVTGSRIPLFILVLVTPRDSVRKL